ncbi:unnamed protein product [Staurois parvus]|uniref:Uncharacterized protein n=1 Tax=Staurois parvus TaxID=386267 RepID=A0ABN9FTL1_9NEOB|nr:unnamed protein product [Staurois parvus]
MISVAPEVPPVRAHHQCQCPSVPCIPVHINATYQCPSELPFNVTHQCHALSVPVSAAYQCLCIAAFQCPSVMPVNAHQCKLPVPPHQCPSVPPISVHQCSLSVPITAASLAHIREGEKSLIYKIV